MGKNTLSITFNVLKVEKIKLIAILVSTLLIIFFYVSHKFENVSVKIKHTFSVLILKIGR